MKLITRNLFVLLTSIALAAASPQAEAAGLVQIILGGQIESTLGARVEFKCEANGTKLEFSGMLGYETGSGDLASLLTRRMDKLGIEVVRGTDADRRGPQSLFIDSCEFVHLRLGAGLTARVVVSEEAPLSLGLLPPRSGATYQDGDLRVVLGLHMGSTDKYDTKVIEVELPGTRPSAPLVSERLSARAMALGLKSSRPTRSTWASSGSHAGAVTTGMSIEVRSDADWGVEVRLAPLVEQR